MFLYAFRNNRRIFMAIGILGFAILSIGNVLAQAEVTIIEVAGDTSVRTWGQAASTFTQKIGVVFNHSSPNFDFLCATNSRVRQNFSPTDAVTLTIRLGDTMEVGTVISTIVVDSSDIPVGGTAFVEWRAENCFILQPETFYNFAWTRDTLDDLDKYDFFFRPTNSSADLTPFVFVPVSGGWVVFSGGTPDFSFKLLGFTDVDFAAPFTPDTAEPLRDVFPFAFFYDIKAIIDTQTTSTEGAFPTVELILFSGDPISSSIEVLSTSTLTEFIGISNIDLIKNSIRLLMWALFSIFIFKTVGNLFK